MAGARKLPLESRWLARKIGTALFVTKCTEALSGYLVIAIFPDTPNTMEAITTFKNICDLGIRNEIAHRPEDLSEILRNLL